MKMKTSQETKMLPPEKGISEADEAQKLLNFTRKFSDEQGRFPTLQELPMENNIVVYYFGSFEKLLRVAWLGQSPPPLRRGKKKRYCRYCNRLLHQFRWFFCDDNCERKFAEENDKILTEEEIKRPVKKPGRRVWHKCRECGEKCKIYLPAPLREPGAKIICKTSSDYQRLSEVYTYPFEEK